MLNLITIVILGVMLLLTLWQLFCGLRPMWITGRTVPAGGTEPVNQASLTVVVFASCDETVLDDWIRNVLAQDYKDFDVVVVYDANGEMTASLAERYADEPRLYFTFIPPGSHTLNRRKLALTIGIKAAKGDYVLTTIPQVRIPSEKWLSGMMSDINEGEGTEVVLGFSHFDFDRLGFPVRMTARVTTVTEGSRWIGDAIAGRPWRGDGNNLIFKRSLFFLNKGFAEGLLLEGGDDDLFVGKIAKADNTSVCVTPETVLTVDWGTVTGKVWELARKRYRSTLVMLPKGPRVTRNMCRLTSILMLPLGVAAACASGFGWLADTLAGFLCVLFYVVEIIAFHRASRRLLPVTQQ